MSFAERRKAVGLTQAQVGEALGISDAAVAQWEKGQTMPKGSRLRDVAVLYNCTVDELLKEDG